jgi:hypothetical protein
MSPIPTPEADNKDELVVRFTVEQLCESTNLLHFSAFGFFVTAWRITRSNPRLLTAVGTLYAYISAQRPGTALDWPRAILGREPTDPARLRVALVTTPDGPPETWTADSIAAQSLDIAVPAVEPWIPAAEIFHLKNRRATG